MKRSSGVSAATLAPPAGTASPLAAPVLSTIVFDCADPELLARFWGELLGVAVAYRDPTWVALERTPQGGRVAFQPVPEGKVAKNRVHLDLLVDELVDSTARVVGLGATAVGDPVHEHNGSYQVLRDPEGNEFCLVTADD